MKYNKSFIIKLIKECIEEIREIQPSDFHNNDEHDTKKLIYGIDSFTESYITTALWSSTTKLDSQGGDPMDNNYDIEDIEVDTLKKMISDCEDFEKKYKKLYKYGEWTDEEAGHDFWLTRNGHGTGFWDKGYNDPKKKQIGKLLTNFAHTYGEFNLYLGDGKYDGLIVGSSF